MSLNEYIENLLLNNDKFTVLTITNSDNVTNTLLLDTDKLLDDSYLANRYSSVEYSDSSKYTIITNNPVLEITPELWRLAQEFENLSYEKILVIDGTIDQYNINIFSPSMTKELNESLVNKEAVSLANIINYVKKTGKDFEFKSDDVNYTLKSNGFKHTLLKEELDPFGNTNYITMDLMGDSIKDIVLTNEQRNSIKSTNVLEKENTISPNRSFNIEELEQ